MMAAMPPTPKPARRAPAASFEPGDAAITDVPADWPALWQQMVAVREGRSGPPPRRGALVWRADGGWCIRGPISARSAALFDLYKPLLDARSAALASPWLLAQMGQSLDGFVATATGDSYFVNGAHSLVHLHRLRALCDAVLVGAGTVAIDNPQLTTRRTSGPNPVRVLIDPGARLDGHSRALHDQQAPTLWAVDARQAEAARERLGVHPPGTAVLPVPDWLAAGRHEPDLPRLLTALAAQGLRVLFVEGGGVTVSRFFAAGVLQRLHLSVAPVLIGEGRRGLRVPPHAVMAECPRPPARLVVLGDDMLWDLDLAAARCAG